MILSPLLANPADAPRAGLWIGLILVAVPMEVNAATTLYALWAALRCPSGREFRYAIIGRRLESHAQ